MKSLVETGLSTLTLEFTRLNLIIAEDGRFTFELMTKTVTIKLRLI